MQTLLNPVFSLLTYRAARLGGGALLGVALLAGCGGGGGDTALPADPEPNPSPAPALTLSQAQGIWQSAAGASTTVSAIVLPDGQMWAVLGDGAGASATTRVLKATLAVQEGRYSATGQHFTLTLGDDASTVTSVAVAARVAEKATLDLNLGAGAEAQSLALAWQARYDTPAQLSTLVGNWSATVGAGVVRWAVDAQGAITGLRTTGCVYTGQLGLRPERKAVVDVQVLEDCAGVRVQLNGVATVQASTDQFSAVLTTADGAQAVLLGLRR